MDKNNPSFTLIEILIVTTIIILLSGFSLVMISTYKDQQLLETVVGRFTQALELAKAKAAAGDTGLCSDSTTAYVSGYSVVVSPSGIQVVPGCNTIPTPLLYPIEPNVVFVTPSLSVQFNSQQYQGSTVSIPIKNTVTNKCRAVAIDETGLITNSDIPCP